MSAAPALPRFLVLYGALFAAFGVASPFLPGLLLEDGLRPEALALVLGSGTAIRSLAGPVCARWRCRSRSVSARAPARTARPPDRARA